ncbi:uncharacterized protein [Cicer arietinum]|uniref:Uncharacterized protein LOC101508207 n=1 Tax=Cicer arietinum TaxID=3827 RepID=A0A1S2XVE8_CICAR|nr:uncharacterized protein LOC101508207 [Cicer arietinum]
MEKKRSKGSFFSLFDWNAKSRKKLVWNNPTLPEVSRQGKENVETLPESQFNRIKVDENGASPSNIASGDFNCTLSVCSDEGCGSKAPGLVARLMGLDSLPNSEIGELSCTSLYGSNSYGASHCNVSALRSMDDLRRADYINTPLKPEKSSWDAMESRAYKMENRPIKRFQTEMLPPKSAKPVPVTHNRLLSPIKNTGFLPPKNAAHIMEAAAKIIDGSPQPYMRNRRSSAGPSSVPLRILDLKERLEAGQYAPMPENLVNLRNANPSNVKPGERSCNNLYKCTSSLKGSRDSEKRSSCHSASKGKSGSLAMQAKNNGQHRDTLVSNGNRKYMKQKEQNEMKSNQLTRSQKPITNRSLPQKTCANRNSNVLVQNNQKQNSMTSKGKSTSKIDSNKPTPRASSSESSTGIRKATNKSAATNVSIQPKRSSSRAMDNRKEFPPSKTHSISQKKKYNSSGVPEARSPENARNNFEKKSIRCNFTTDGSIDQDAFNMNESNDVISFTFTSPLKRSMPESLSSTEQVMETRTRFGVDSLGHGDNLHPRKLSLSPTHMIDSDALSVLLEQKLQELTSRLNLSQCTLASDGPSTGLRSSLQDKAFSIVNTITKEQDEMFSDKLDGVHTYQCCSSDDPVLKMNQQLQTSEVRDSCCGNRESGNDLGCQHSNAVAVFQAPSVSESYLDSEDSTYGSTAYSSMQDEEVSNMESESLENEATWSEESSSISMGHNVAVTQISGIPNMVDVKLSSNMELEYVQNILGNAEFMAEEFVMGRTNTVIMPNLFDLLENHQSTRSSYCEEEYSKLERKVLFDYVSECLELRCEQAFVGRCKAWPKWVTSIQKKNILAEELYKEMVSFKNMEEVMVDELVCKDMSTGYGKWLDFDFEAFEEGLEVEGDILTCLIDELVSELLIV